MPTCSQDDTSATPELISRPANSGIQIHRGGRPDSESDTSLLATDSELGSCLKWHVPDAIPWRASVPGIASGPRPTSAHSTVNENHGESTKCQRTEPQDGKSQNCPKDQSQNAQSATVALLPQDGAAHNAKTVTDPQNKIENSGVPTHWNHEIPMG